MRRPSSLAIALRAGDEPRIALFAIGNGRLERLIKSSSGWSDRREVKDDLSSKEEAKGSGLRYTHHGHSHESAAKVTDAVPDLNEAVEKGVNVRRKFTGEKEVMGQSRSMIRTARMHGRSPSCGHDIQMRWLRISYARAAALDFNNCLSGALTYVKPRTPRIQEA